MNQSPTPPQAELRPAGTPGRPRILAVETSSRNGSIALAVADELLICRPFDQSRPRRDHVVDLLPTLDPAMAELGWKPADIDEVYVSAGPGSFTGLRIALTFAKTLAQAVGCRLVMVPTVEVLAENAPADVMNLAIVLDAKRGQIYTAVLARVAPARVAPPSGSMRGGTGQAPSNETAVWGCHPTGGFKVVVPVGVMPPADMLAAAPRPLHLIGEGIDYHRDTLNIGGEIIELPREIWPPRAEAVLRVGRRLALAGRYTRPEDATPIYLRRPEAEEVWERRHKSGTTDAHG